MHASMETALAFMNHFPLFAVMLRLKDSGRLPGSSTFSSSLPASLTLRRSGGLQFELCETSISAEISSVDEGLTPRPYLQLKNNALGLAGIFFAQSVLLLQSQFARLHDNSCDSLQLSRRLASHYSPVYLLGRLLSGELPPLLCGQRLNLASRKNNWADSSCPTVVFLRVECRDCSGEGGLTA